MRKGEAEEGGAIKRVIGLLEDMLKTEPPSETHEKLARERLKVARGLLEIKYKRKLTPDDVEAAMRVVCWEDLAGCCAPAKNCMFFLAACEALRLDPEEVYKAKSVAVRNLLRAKKRLPLYY